jgi:hypothetical protein
VHVKSRLVSPEVSRTLIDTVVLGTGPDESATSTHKVWVDPLGTGLLPYEIFTTTPPIVCVEVLSDAVEEVEVEVDEVDELEEAVSEVVDVDRTVFEEVVADVARGVELCPVVVVDFDPPVFEVSSE